jgi:hypothetical protein
MEKPSSSGTVLPTTLFIVFLVLKLTNNIDWSWVWVTSPLWIPLLLTISIVFILIIIFIILILSGKSLDDIKDMISKIQTKI